MRDDTGKDVNTEKSQRDDEHVEEAVIAFPHTIANPRTVVIKAICKSNTSHPLAIILRWNSQGSGPKSAPTNTVIAEGTVRSTRGAKDFTGEAVL